MSLYLGSSTETTRQASASWRLLPVTWRELFASPVMANSKSLRICSPSSFFRDSTWREKILFKIFLWNFGRARVCWPLLCLCRPFCICERCLDSNPESCRRKQARYQLATYLPNLAGEHIKTGRKQCSESRYGQIKFFLPGFGS